MTTTVFASYIGTIIHDDYTVEKVEDNYEFLSGALGIAVNGLPAIRDMEDVIKKIRCLDRCRIMYWCRFEATS